MATSISLMRVLSMTSRLSRNIISTQGKRCHRGLSTAASKNDSQTEASTPPPPEGNTQDEDLKKVTEELKSQITKLEEDVKENKDKYMRALAEAENVRNRMTKQVEDAKIFGIQGFCKDLLEVSDILRTAVNSVPKDQLNNSNPHLVSLFEGLNMTEGQLVKVFKKHGLESIEPAEGEKFDPNIHEALFQVPIQSKETQVSDTVAIVQKIGFRLHSRTLRPALVGVFK